jgi:hypothetical protein
MIENGLGSRDVLPGAADALAATAIPASGSDRPAPAPAAAPAAIAPRVARLLAEEY